MSTLIVGSGQTYTTIEGAVSAAQSGDTIDVQAGVYTNDFITANKSLTLDAVGGTVTLLATQSPPNGKAILDEGGSGITVAVNGFAFAGASVPDGNGAGIRYEGGTLNISNSHFYDNQDGILGAPDPNGVITIDRSEFNDNGAGDGYTHNLYIGDIKQFTLTNSYIHDALVGHEVKSRAANNTITNNRILDNSLNASYEIDLPNGGNANVSGNTIEQSATSQNPNIIAYGEEGNLNSGTSLSVTGNTIVNDLGSGPALWNATGATATFSNNSVYGFGGGALVDGPVTQSGTTVLGTRPALDTSSAFALPAAPAATGAGLVVNVAEDAYQGDAQFTVTVDGEQVGGLYTATASHGAGQSQAVPVIGSLTAGVHVVGVTFVNDVYGGSSAMDRNLYVTGASYDGTAASGAAATLDGFATDTFAVTVPTGASVAQPVTMPVTTPVTTPTPTPTPTPAPTSDAGLVLDVAEDAYQGDAQFTVAVDGTQVGGVDTATASHAAGQFQAITVANTLGAGSHSVAVSFINDAYGGSPSTDRNLYVTGASYNGVALPGAASSLFSNGTASFVATVGSALTSSAVINVSEDAYQGDAQFTVAVDGKQYGGVYTATASHAAGQSQAIGITGIPENFTAHDIAVTFLNDAYGGSPSTDRNLYVNSVQLDNQAVPNAAASLFNNGTQHFSVTAPLTYKG